MGPCGRLMEPADGLAALLLTYNAAKKSLPSRRRHCPAAGATAQPHAAGAMWGCSGPPIGKSNRIKSEGDGKLSEGDSQLGAPAWATWLVASPGRILYVGPEVLKEKVPSMIHQMNRRIAGRWWTRCCAYDWRVQSVHSFMGLRRTFRRGVGVAGAGCRNVCAGWNGCDAPGR